jgi:UDP-glucose 4-epimerase
VPTNPYGRTKLQVEEILSDVSRANPAWKIACLRYFNPAGAHDSGLIGENPKSTPNNLMPYVSRVALGYYPYLRVFGSDYETRDGTGERDYIHVMDLAEAHLAALLYVDLHQGFEVINIGTGKSASVLDIVSSYEKISGKSIPLEYVGRRPGDLAVVYASCDKANQLLSWKANRSIQEMCATSWKFVSKIPKC